MNNQDTATLLPSFLRDIVGSTEKLLHYGAILTPDSRDHKLEAYIPVVAKSQPVSYYPNLDGIPHWMQNKLGACVGHAAGKSQLR